MVHTAKGFYLGVLHTKIYGTYSLLPTLMTGANGVLHTKECGTYSREQREYVTQLGV